MYAHKFNHLAETCAGTMLAYFEAMKHPSTLVLGLLLVAGSSSAAMAGTTRDHRDSSSSSSGSVRDHRDSSPAPDVRDHRDSSPAADVRDHRSSETTPAANEPVAATDHRSEPQNDVQASSWGGSSSDSYNGPKINWARARFGVDSFVRRVSALDSTAGLGVQLTGDITQNLYLGVELASGVPMSGAMNTNATFRQAGVVAGVRGEVLPRFTLGVEAALGIQEFRDVNTIVDLRVKAEQRLASNISLGIYGGRNVNAERDIFAGMNLVFHSGR